MHSARINTHGCDSLSLPLSLFSSEEQLDRAHQKECLAELCRSSTNRVLEPVGSSSDRCSPRLVIPGIDFDSIVYAYCLPFSTSIKNKEDDRHERQANTRQVQNYKSSTTLGTCYESILIPFGIISHTCPLLFGIIPNGTVFQIDS